MIKLTGISYYSYDCAYGQSEMPIPDKYRNIEFKDDYAADRFVHNHITEFIPSYVTGAITLTYTYQSQSFAMMPSEDE